MIKHLKTTFIMKLNYISNECNVCGLSANTTKSKTLTHLVVGGLEEREERLITKAAG